MPKPDYENAMDYFTEYMEEAGEQHVMEELGTPREAAAELIHNFLGQGLGDGAALGKGIPAMKKAAKFYFLSMMVTPLGIPGAACAMFSFLLVFLAFSCMAIMAFFCSFLLVLAGGTYLLYGLAAIFHSLSGACMAAGVGFCGIGIGILGAFCTAFVYRWIFGKTTQMLQSSIRAK